MISRGWLLVLLVTLGTCPTTSAGQPPLFLVNSETEVESVEFRFSNGRSVDRKALERELALSGPTTGHRVRAALSVLPGISGPSRAPFSPPDLLKDVERIRRFYESAGFKDTEVGYSVTLDTVSNAVDITFEIQEGDPIILTAVRLVQDSTGEDLSEALPPEVQSSFTTLRAIMEAETGQRLSESLQIRLRDRVAAWLSNRGFPFPRVAQNPLTGSDAGVVLELRVQTGPRARVRARSRCGAGRPTARRPPGSPARR